MAIVYKPIGTIHTPFKTSEGMPIQPRGGKGVKGTVVIDKKYTGGLQSLGGFSHIYLIYHLHQSKGFNLTVTPFLDDKPHGVFSTRAPRRPNSIGLSVVKLIRIEGNVLYIENLDIIDGTPLLDIKPYTSEFDSYKTEKNGWLSNRAANMKNINSDGRFK